MTVPDFDPVSTSLRATLGATSVRAAEALLRSLGDGGIVLRLPLPTVVPNSDLGLAGPLTEDVTLGPALLQVIQPDTDGRKRYEAVIASQAVDEQIERRNLQDADDLFDSALGIVANGKLLRIVNATPHTCGARVFLYRVQATG